MNYELHDEALYGDDELTQQDPFAYEDIADEDDQREFYQGADYEADLDGRI